MCTKMFHSTPGETQSITIMMASTPRFVPMLQILPCSFQYWVRARVCICLAYSSLVPRPHPAFRRLQYLLLFYHTGSNGKLGRPWEQGQHMQHRPSFVTFSEQRSLSVLHCPGNRSSDAVKQYHYMVQMQPFNSTNTSYMAILTTTLVH